MQKSKKMMVSLCGLALSSLFVLNNKSVVHADAVTDGSQNNAISWNSDSDAAQNVQNTQKADDHQQNAQSVQPSRVETSTVHSSSAAPRTTNQNTAVQSPRVANVQDAEKSNPIVINNPAGDKVNVHYVNRDGGAISDPNVKDTTIDVTKTGQGSYQVPNGYNVNNPDGKYTISGGAFNVTNLKGNIVSKSEAEEVTEKFPWQIGVYEQDNSTAAPFNLVGDITGDVAKLMQNKSELGLRDAVRQAFLNKAKGLANSYGVTWDDDFEDNSGEVHKLSDKDFANAFDKLLPVKFGNSDGEFDSQHGFINDESKYNSNSERAAVSLDSAFWFSDDNGDQNVQLTCAAVRPTQSTNYNWTHEKTVQYTEQQLPVAFVDANNNIVGMVQNYSGKVGTSQKISLSLPTGYKLAANQTMPTSVTFKNDTSPLLIKIVASGEKAKVDNPENNLVHVKFVDQSTGKDIGGSYDMYTYNLSGNTGTYSVPAGYATQNNTYDVDSAVQLIRNDLFGANAQKWRRLNTIMSDDDVKKLDEMCTQIENKYRAMGYNVSDIALANNGGIAIKSSANHDPLDDVLTNTGKQTDLPDDYMVLTTFVSDPSDHKHTGTVAVDKITNISQDELKKIWNTAQSSDYGGDIMLTRATEPIGISDKGNIVSGNTVTVPVHKSNSESFIDNSGNAISANGNTVSVVLTKPQSVNPATDTRCQSQATRTIQINFPDGQVPKSYDGIVDKSGKLVQTVHFTRTATEDALTGNILQYGNWTSDNQDPNFIGFPERTLPRIPGYTLSIKPAVANA